VEPRTGWGLVAAVVALLQVAVPGVARADNPPAPAPPPSTVAAPTAEDESARRYEDAVRADAGGKLNEAKQLAQQGLALAPHGPYAASLQRLLDRIAHEELDRIEQSRLRLKEPQFAARASPAAARGSFVFAGALAGISEGILVAGAANAGGPGTAGGGLAGLAIGLAATLASMSEVSDPAVPAHLWLGWLYGGFAGLAIAALAQGEGASVALGGAIGLPLGAAGGILTATLTDSTEGDAAAGLALFVHLAVLPVLFGVAFAPNGEISAQTAAGLALAGGTLGLLTGELLNHELGWSEGRWGLIWASGTLGGLVGLLILVAASATGPGAVAGVAAGEILGLTIGIVATDGFLKEAPRGYQLTTTGSPPAANALPPSQGPSGRAPRAIAVPLAVFPFSL